MHTVAMPCREGDPGGRLPLLSYAIVLLWALPAQAQMVQLPGQWYDQDKYTDASGGRLAWWFYEDLDPSLGYDNKYWWEIGGALAKHMTSVPGWPDPSYDPHPEHDTGWDWSTKPRTTWKWVSPITGNIWRPGYDGTCWMADADNLYRYVTGRPSQYDGWAYQGDWPRGTVSPGGTPLQWQWGGDPSVCLLEVGLKCSDEGASGGSWPVSPETALRDLLALGLPVSLGVTWAGGDGFGGSSHLITCYGIDAVNRQIIIACPDSEWFGDFGTMNYQFGDYQHPDEPNGTIHTNVFHILGYGARVNSYRTVITNGWIGSGTGGGTAVTGPTTEWHNPANWTSGAVPGDIGLDANLDISRVPLVAFENSGLVRVTTADARAARLILSGDGAQVFVAGGGRLELGSLFIRRQGGPVVTGRLSVAGELLANRADIIDGRLEAAGGAIHIRQADPDAAAADLCALNMTELVVGNGGSIAVDRDLRVQHEPGGWGVCTISKGAMATGGSVTVGGAVVIDNGCALTVMGDHDVQVKVEGGLDLDGEDSLGAGGWLTLHRAAVRVQGTLYAARHGDATIDIQGGTLTIGYMYLGYGTGRQATLDLVVSGGAAPALRTTGSLVNLYAGWYGDAAVTQSAGAVGREGPGDAHPDLWLGHRNSSYGKYSLNGGTVEVGDLHVGLSGAGLFVQQGGVVTVHGTLVSASGHATEGSSYRLDAGTLNLAAARADSNRVQFLYNGGTLNLTGPTYGFHDLLLAAGGESDVTLVLDGKTVHVANDLIVGKARRGVLTQSGGVVTAGRVRLADAAAGETSRYDLVGGMLEAAWVEIGASAPARMDIDGAGTVKAGSLHVGGDFAAGLAACYQHDGAVGVTGDLVLGCSTGKGYYLLGAAAGNVLETGATVVGDLSEGLFEQSGGTHTVAGTLTIARQGTGTYCLNGGDLFAAAIVVGGSETAQGGTGTFTIDGGNAAVEGTLLIWSGSEAHLGAGTMASLDEDRPYVDVMNSGTLYIEDGVYCLGRVQGIGDALAGTVVVASGATLWVESIKQDSLIVEAGGTIRFAAEDYDLFLSLARANQALVPEPGTLALMGLGALVLARRRGRRFPAEAIPLDAGDGYPDGGRHRPVPPIAYARQDGWRDWSIAIRRAAGMGRPASSTTLTAPRTSRVCQRVAAANSSRHSHR